MADPVVEAVGAEWASALDVDRVDPHTGFFDLGATSLMVMQVVGALRGRWPALKVVDVFANPTVASLAAFLADSEVRQAPSTAAREP